MTIMPGSRREKKADLNPIQNFDVILCAFAKFGRTELSPTCLRAIRSIKSAYTFDYLSLVGIVSPKT